MTIEPTDGYIMNTEMRAGYEVSASNDSYYFLGFSMVNRPQPNGNRDDDQYGYLQEMKIKLNDAGGTSTLDRYHSIEFNGANAEIAYSTSSAVDLWTDFQDLSAKTNGSRKTTKQSGVRVEKGLFTSRYEGTGGAFSTTVDAILMERNPDNINTDNIEATGCHKATPSAYEWSPFGENESASAYVFKDIAVNNGLVVNGKTAESRTYPIFRAVGGVD